jgi:hypothetical protein
MIKGRAGKMEMIKNRGKEQKKENKGGEGGERSWKGK